MRHNIRRCEAVFQTVTIVPRLGYSAKLASDIARDLRSERATIKSSNKALLKASGDDDALYDAIDVEKTLEFSLEVLLHARQKIMSVSEMFGIPKMLLPTIHAVRTISAQLHDVMPECSQKLCELSVHLGSIVLDSASMSAAKFDFGQSNLEATLFLDEVKLIVDSKINKQYHNLGFFIE